MNSENTLFYRANKAISVDFSAEEISSDGSLILLEKIEREQGLLKYFSSIIPDAWDRNGNQVHHRNPFGIRFMCWDEENRISAIHDRGEMSNLSVYLYDDTGERTWKLTGDEMQVQVNGQTTYSNVNFDKTLYASPYLVMDEHEYTKHYYIEGERICSKIGGGFGPAAVQPTSTPLNFIVGDEDDCSEDLFALTKRFILCTDYTGNWEISHSLQPAYNTNNNFEDKQYFYHPDHLGSSSFITNAFGKAEQHLQYLPFGELWINQRTSEFNSPYKFSAKELDSESGYNYFGARYYDSEASIWLSVDPMSDKYPGLSPYNYCANNPVMLIDPNGREIRIYYKEKRGIGRLFERAQYITYTPGMNYTGDNNFVSNSVNSLNYIHNNNADVEGIIQQSVSTSEIVKVKKSSGDYYDDSNKTIHWSTKGMKVWDNSSGTEKKGRQSGALGLFHELGHFYRDVFKSSEFDTDFNTPDQDYDNMEERRVIENYETPAAKILNEGTRNNHSGVPLNTVDPTSTKTRRDIRKENRINE